MRTRGFFIQPKRTYIRNLAAIAISLLLHLIMLGGMQLHMPEFSSEPNPIRVQLFQPALPEPQLPVEKSPVKKAAVNKAKPGRTKTESPSIPSSDSHTTEAPAQALLPEENSGPVEETPSAEEVSEPEPVPVPRINYAEMDYEVKSGKEGSVMGTTHVTYKSLEGNRYTLSSETEARGLASLFLSGKLLQVSEGEVTPHGLRPLQFLYQYGKNESKTRRAEFDWDNMTVKLKTAKGETSKSLVEGAQDLLSFMYQFMFEPPMTHMGIAVVNGKRISQYTYAFEGEETVNTRMGDIHTVHISKTSGEGDEKTELWLATDYRNLPVKIRKTEEDGKVYEQIITRLDTDIMK